MGTPSNWFPPNVVLVGSVLKKSNPAGIVKSARLGVGRPRPVNRLAAARTIMCLIDFSFMFFLFFLASPLRV
jgi:hypothetical protein